MSFFDDEPMPQTEDDVEEDERESRTSSFIGAVVPCDQLLGVTDISALALRKVVAFPDGFELSIISYVRGNGLKKLRSAYERSSPRQPFLHQSSWHSLNIGLLYPDGSKLFESPDRFRTGSPALGPALESTSGGGNDEEYVQNLFAWPLPGEGELKLIFEWSDFGIPESSITLDATAITAAGFAAKPVWEDDRDKPSHYTSSMWHDEDDE